ncbi:DUF6174 domain-containing protein [Streptomyces sp. M41]|uniref:DUF6174 domain-containing protein n=1 Tax=Streptomyces sp. M41 TaxID=3059412 RepID=UPI00374D922C
MAVAPTAAPTVARPADRAGIRARVRAALIGGLVGGLICAVGACGTGLPASSGSAEKPGTRGAAAQHRAAWREPGSYTYTLLSTGGERSLLGTFRISVRDGAVVDAVGLDDTGRRVAESVPDAVPTIGGLLAELRQARRDGADRAEAQYAADGHPVRISLDREENAIDDETLYLIGDYAPGKK